MQYEGNRHLSVSFFSYQYLYKNLRTTCVFLYLIVCQDVTLQKLKDSWKNVIPLHCLPR